MSAPDYASVTGLRGPVMQQKFDALIDRLRRFGKGRVKGRPRVHQPRRRVEFHWYVGSLSRHRQTLGIGV